MGFLDKTNPAATAESVIRTGTALCVVFAIAFLVYAMFQPVNWWLFPLWILFGGFVGALLEWQSLDDVPIEQVVYEAEDHFKVKVPPAKVRTIESAGDLYEAVRAELPEANAEEVWEELRALLAYQCDWDKDEVVKSARFNHELN
jgi:hypothetical protein